VLGVQGKLPQTRLMPVEDILSVRQQCQPLHNDAVTGKA